jgi:peptidoglycan/LPS O-acetylase OafA/YrhL
VFSDKSHELYAAFSIYKNGAILFDVGRKESSNVLLCLDGLRTAAMLHIMLGHRYGWTRSFPNVNSNIFAVDGKWMKTLFSAFVNVHPIAVDSFFVMGGLLEARSMLNNIERFVMFWGF